MLEQLFGAKLLLYAGHKVQLTPEGRELYRTAEHMLHDGDKLAMAIQHMKAGQSGRLSVGVSSAFEQPYFFDQIVGPFSRLHPEVNLSLRFGESSRLADNVLAHDLDLAYVLRTRLPTGVKYESLHGASFVFLVAPSHPLAGKDALTAEEVGQAGIIAERLDKARSLRYRELLRAAGLSQFRIALEVNGLQARILAALAGLGVVATFWPSYAHELSPYPLQPLRLNASPLTYDVGLISRDDQDWTPLMADFAGWLFRATTSPAQTRTAIAVGAEAASLS
jgi:DNA-binding transcriptional LysR family regulator